MKQHLRKIFAPILNRFESGQGDFNYRKSHRAALIAVGALFWVIAIASGVGAVSIAELAAPTDASAEGVSASMHIGAWIPVIVFFAGGSLCLIVGLLGNNRAIATLWGSK
ncbi:MAG TPA: hypothetical protein VIC26_05940 [Marinagarivorans sp.]